MKKRKMRNIKFNFLRKVFIKNILLTIPYLLIIGLIYLIFIKGVNQEFTLMATILGVVTFLFGTFLALSLSDRRERIDKIRENDSIERSQLITLAYSSEIFGKNFKKNIVKAIDEYLIATLDYDIWDYYKTEPHFQDIFNKILRAPLNTKKQASFFSSLIFMGNTLGKARRQTIGLIEDRLSKSEWVMFLSLSSVLIATMILINTGSIVSLLIILILSFTVIILLRFLYSLDSLRWKENIRIFEPYEKTFEAIGLIRYYPESLIMEKRINKFVKPYRIAHYPHPYPNFKDKKIKIIKI